MFSRLLKSARSFLIDKPQIETIRPSSETIEETMVTTRGKQVETPLGGDLDEENTILVHVPTSSKKRSRRAKLEDTPEMSAQEESVPSSTKKRKTLPLREREVESLEGNVEDVKGVKTRPVVEIPARKATPPKGQIDGVTSVGSSEKREEQQDVVTKKTHKRFGSEDLDEEFFSTVRDSNEGYLVEAPIVLSDDESEESDDAPEAIGIQEAAQTIKSKDRDAAKIVKYQLAATRKKRQERDEFLKKQSESRKKRKRHATEEELPIAANVDAALPSDAPNPHVEPDVEDEEIYAGSNVENEAPAGASIPLPRFIANRNTLPELLPAEYLEDTEPREIARVDDPPIKKSKRTNIQDSTTKEPKDRRIGATTYRVTKPQSTNLAPKASFQARSTKEKWLQGRVGKNEQSSRKPFSKGFVKK